MFSRFVDLSIPITDRFLCDPGSTPTIERVDHKQGGPMLARLYGDQFGVDRLPDQEGFAAETVTLSTHQGTHMDAPWHYGRTQDGGRPAMTIDTVPLEWGFGPGVKLDFRHFEDGYVATAGDVEAELDRIGHRLAPGDIVVVNTRAGRRLGEEDYVSSGCGMGRAATLYLLERGVRTVGTDGWSWDAPFAHQRDIAETEAWDRIWEGHYAGKTIGYGQLEKLHNLEAIPATGYWICCFPVKVEGASAGWTRAVAMFA